MVCKIYIGMSLTNLGEVFFYGPTENLVYTSDLRVTALPIVHGFVLFMASHSVF